MAQLKTRPTGASVDGYEGHADLLAALGPHSTGRSCLYIKRLADVDQQVLTRLVEAGLR
jgi:hypothetical protein